MMHAAEDPRGTPDGGGTGSYKLVRTLSKPGLLLSEKKEVVGFRANLSLKPEG